MVAACPLTTLAGVRTLRVGSGVVIGRLAGAESATVGAGLWTVTLAVRPGAGAAAVTGACRGVALTYVVSKETPSTRTTELGTKSAPVTVSCNDVEPANAVAGVSELMDGG